MTGRARQDRERDGSGSDVPAGTVTVPPVDAPEADGVAAADGDRPSPFAARPRSRWPRLPPDVLAVVFLGGCAGGLVRYAVELAWGSDALGFPYPVLAVNLAGAFVLAVVVVTVAEIRPSRYLRPLWGTGFCGALTTFSAVVVALARLLSHERYAVAAAYLVATVVGGLLAAALGLVLTRAAAAQRRRARHPRSAECD